MAPGRSGETGTTCPSEPKNKYLQHLFTIVSRSGTAAALCVAAARRPTRTSAWQNTPPASSLPVRGALARLGSRGGRRRRVLVRPHHAEFYRRVASRPRRTVHGGRLTTRGASSGR